MKVPAVKPTVTEDTSPMGGIIKTHPAYGMLGFSRVSGSPGKLFGSEIEHMNSIRLTLTRGEDHRTLSRNWYHGRNHLVEVELSAAQFAELITSMNVGSGVPCTIRYLPGEQVPTIQDEDNYHEQMQADLTKEAKDAYADTRRLRAQLGETLAKSGLSKVKQKELMDIADRIVMAVDSSMPFVLDQYKEGAEKIGAKAKAELDAFATMVVTSLGKQTLAQLQEKNGEIPQIRP